MIEARDIAAILLAAGRSQRFGDEDKLLAELDGEALGIHAARRIVELQPGRRIAVCSDVDSSLARQFAALGFEIVLNTHPEHGLSHSLASGIGLAAQGRAEAALICLADMPFVGINHLRALLTRFDPETAPVVASERDGAVMPPALFARTLFDRLQQGEGDQGGRALLASAVRVPAPADELIDIDRPEEMPRER